MTQQQNQLFPEGFLWGAATSAHQVEGGNHNNWTVWELENARSLAKAARYKLDQLPVWPEVQRLASTPQNYVSGRTIDHYNRYEADFDIVKKLYLNAFRFSIEWSRIEPKEGVWDAQEIEHYRRYIAALKARGIEPLITLYHWTVPVWFAVKGAFSKAGNISYFVRFADKVFEEFGKDLRIVSTINEPDTVAVLGYYLQEHAPAERSLWKMLWVYRNHLKAHKRAYSIIKMRSKAVSVGFVKNYSHIMAADDRLTSRLMAWADRVVRDSLVLRYVGRKTDFYGVNYYFTDRHDGLHVSGGSRFNRVKTDEPINDLGWSMHPSNLEFVLKRLGRRKKPLYVMETGVADRNDAFRKDWLTGTIRSVEAALASGVDVRGYLHWSMFDNFEWQYGRWPCFGLIGIDYERDLKRVVRKSALYYGAYVKKVRGK